MPLPTKIFGDKVRGLPVIDKLLRRNRRGSDASSAPPPSHRMGQFVSSRKKTASESEPGARPGQPISLAGSSASAKLAQYMELFKERGYLPDFLLIHEHPSSMYIDEDGDIANEFYAEDQLGTKRRLCRIMKNLRPQGTERYQIPRLNPDCPVVMLEMKAP
ncbi:unnamed protein product, partial [Mesorhabditis spiculigera]